MIREKEKYFKCKKCERALFRYLAEKGKTEITTVCPRCKTINKLIIL